MADRHQFRADWHDYNDGVYFATICCHDMRHYFGRISDGVIEYSAVGKELIDRINLIESIHSDCQVWNYVVMPNHVHLLISIEPEKVCNKKKNTGCLHNAFHNEECRDFHHNSRFSIVINHLKGHLTKFAKRNNIPFRWQSRMYDNIITNQESYRLVMNYIDSNIETWESDRFNKE